MNKLILEEQSLFFNEESLSEVLNEGIIFSKEDIKRNYEATEKSYKKLIQKYKINNDNKSLRKFLYRLKDIYENTSIYYKNKNYFKVVSYMRSSTVSILKVAGLTAAAIASIGLSAAGGYMFGYNAAVGNTKKAIVGAAMVATGITSSSVVPSVMIKDKDEVFMNTAKIYSEKFIKLLQSTIKEVKNYLK